MQAKNRSLHTWRPKLLWFSSGCELALGAVVGSLWQPQESCLEEEA